MMFRSIAVISPVASVMDIGGIFYSMFCGAFGGGGGETIIPGGQ
jgi:hypothetical protein